MTSNDGGAAFPHTVHEFHDHGQSRQKHGGMSLRDYFAAHALTGILGEIQLGGQPVVIENVVDIAFKYADAMLAERAKPREVPS